MKKGNKLIALLLTMVFTILSVNTVNVEAKTKNLTAKQILKKATATSSKIKSFTMTADMQLAMKYQGKTEKLKTSYKMQYNKKPLRVKMISTSRENGKTVKSVGYYARKGNKIYAYTKQGNSYVKSQVYGMTVSDINSMNPAKMLKENMKYLENTKIKSQNGKVSGRSAYVLTSEVSLDKLLEDADSDSEELEKFKGKKVKITYWIDKKTYYPLKCTVDIKSLYNFLLESFLGDEEVKLSKCNITITYTKINKTGTVKLPSGVK